MGLNIPYTHSEERPSRTLLSKSSIAGAHSMLLYLLARTPEAPIVKEIKPAAAIAWKRIGAGPVLRRGHPIRLYDCPPERALDVEEALSGADGPWSELLDGSGRPRVLESVYIDTGENGMFSCEEFETVTALGQMEYVTPEEIATDVLLELKGGTTGREVVAALDGHAGTDLSRGRHAPPGARADAQTGGGAGSNRSRSRCWDRRGCRSSCTRHICSSAWRAR